MSANIAKAKRTPAGQILRASARLWCWEVLTGVAVAMLLWWQDSPRPILMKYMGYIPSS